MYGTPSSTQSVPSSAIQSGGVCEPFPSGTNGPSGRSATRISVPRFRFWGRPCGVGRVSVDVSVTNR